MQTKTATGATVRTVQVCRAIAIITTPTEEAGIPSGLAAEGTSDIRTSRHTIDNRAMRRNNTIGISRGPDNNNFQATKDHGTKTAETRAVNISTHNLLLQVPNSSNVHSMAGKRTILAAHNLALNDQPRKLKNLRNNKHPES